MTLLVEGIRGELLELQERLEEVYNSIYYPLVLVDATGDEVVIDHRPERIVSMAPSVTETIYFVNATDRLVGVDDYSDYPPWIQEARSNGTIASIGGFWDPSVEAILSLEPDLVIGVATAPSHVQVKKILEAQGIPVLLLPSNSLDDVIESIVMVGKAVGNPVDAYRVVKYMRASISSAELLFAQEEQAKVAVIVWLEPLFVVGGGTWEDEIIRLAGGVNVFSDLEGWPIVSPEALLDRSPDVIILLGGHGVLSKEDFLSLLRDSLGSDANSIPAVANDRVYVLEGLYTDVYARPSPRTVLGIYVVGALVNPAAVGLTAGELPDTVDPGSLNMTEVLAGVVPDIVLDYIRVVSS